MTERLRQQLALELALPLRVQARRLADGLTAGSHRAARKGSGIEFAGHRPYTPGDDLRHLDRHALLRHSRLLVREFHTDTERSVHLVADVSASMNYRGTREQMSAPTKGQRALVLSAALALAAHRTGDTLGLSLVGDSERLLLPPRPGREALERILAHLERAFENQRSGAAEAREPTQRGSTAVDWERTLDHLGARLPRGAVLFVLSDFLDTTDELSRKIQQLSTRGRTVRALQILTRDEIDFPFDGALRLVDPETGVQIETEGALVRKDYQDRLASLTADLSKKIEATGGLWLRHVTDETPDHPLYQLSLGVHR